MQCRQSTLTFNGGNSHSDSSGYTTVVGACDSPAMRFEGRQPLAVVRKLLDIGVPINQAAYSQHLLRPPNRVAFLIRPLTPLGMMAPRRSTWQPCTGWATWSRSSSIVEPMSTRRYASLLQVEDVLLLRLLYFM